MLYVLVGENRDEKRKRINTIKRIASSSSSLTTFVRDSTSVQIDELHEWMETETGLFGEKVFVELDAATDDESIISFFEKKGGDVVGATTIFIVSEQKLSAAKKKIFEDLDMDIEVFTEIKKSDEFSIFALTDAFCARDKKQTWLLLRKALEKASPEEVHGTLWWQTKILLQVGGKEKSSAELLGIKPFVYTKATHALKKYSREEIEVIGGELVDMYHDSHIVIVDFCMRLEQLILKRF